MPNIEYLDPAIANEGSRADESLTPMEAPHIFDYAPLKANPKYAKYFQAHVYERYPAIFYHRNGDRRVVTSHDEASELVGVRPIRGGWICDGDWKDSEADAIKKQKPDVTSTGKSLVASGAAQAAQGTNEIMAQILQQLIDGKSAASPALSDAISKDAEYQEYVAWKRAKAAAGVDPGVINAEAKTDAATELSETEQKDILIEVAKENGIKADKRWSIDKIKTELDKVSDKAA